MRKTKWQIKADAWNRKAMAEKDLLEIYQDELARLERDRELGMVDDLTYQVESGKLNRIINNLT
tara:strand:- start:18158 stop:18349 length:192 start_codon:yes stop_codon:yes gene_type:complete